MLAWLCLSVNGQERTELPAEQEREELILRDHYAFSYSVVYELSSFVAYNLTKEAALKSEEVKGKNDEDEGVSTGTADDKDYKKSGYAMGQLIPAENFAHEPETADKLFLMSNIAPMNPTFYTKSWKNIEKLFRAWTIQGEIDLYIVAGPILADAPFGTFGDSKVSIPERYYKAVLDLKNERAVGFVFKNSYAQNIFYKYAMSIDELEEITGIDFFVNLEDTQEGKIEKHYAKEDWDWEAAINVYGE
jgi:endonuclease G